VVPEIVHLPGEALQLDWGLLCTVTCAETGQRRKVWALAGVLGYSRVMTVRLVWTNSVEVTMAAIEDMLIELGGVPKRVTSDNPKCFALAASTFEPLLNPAFEMLASHYDFAIECLPPADPKKKGKIERLMPFIRRLYESHGEWSGIEEAEAFLRGKVIIANDRKHGTTGEKPSERFEKEEKGALKPLPPLRYENHEIAEPIVRKDGHVRFKGKYYSVGDGLKGSSVVVLGNARIVRIYLKGKLLCVHDRITNRAVSKSTKDEHKKPWERTFAENSHLIKSAHSIGPSVGAFVANILKEQHGFVETRIVWGVIKLAEKYSKQDLNDACAMAMESHTYSYLYVKRILDSTSKAIKEEKKQPHTFIRSMDEYTSIIKRNGAKNERYSTSGATSQPSPIDSRAGASGTSHNSEARSSDGLGGLTP
jgi:hypothetical protein